MSMPVYEFLILFAFAVLVALVRLFCDGSANRLWRGVIPTGSANVNTI
jgi:hypothetical protein